MNDAEKLRKLTDAVLYKQYDAVRDLVVNQGAAVNGVTQWGWGALHQAAGQGDIRMIDLLVELGADVRLPGASKRSALFYAVGKDPAVAARLIQLGVPVNARDARGATALHAAAEAGDTGLIELLVARGIDRQARDVGGQTAVFAVTGAHGAALRSLIRLGLGVNVCDIRGMTPLHRAVLTRDTAKIKLLCEVGAELSIKDRDGKTPAELARGETRQWVDAYFAQTARQRQEAAADRQRRRLGRRPPGLL